MAVLFPAEEVAAAAKFEVEGGDLEAGAQVGELAEGREALAGDGAGNERTIDVQVNRLRRKIELDPADPRFLQTARGAGYRLVTDR